MTAEVLREGALVAEAAVGGDLAEGAGGSAQEMAGGGDARLDEELLRGQTEDALELALHGADGETAFAGE